MKISSIEKFKKLYKLNFLDREGIYINENTLIKFNLVKGRELSLQEYENIILHDKNESAFNKAAILLSRTVKSENEVAEYLFKKDFQEENIVFAIKKLRELNFIDDRKYAYQYTKDRFSVRYKGPEYIKRKLLEKKINEEYIDSAISEICREDHIIDNLYKLIEKDYLKLSMPENKKIQKITTKLYTNGYSFDIIKRAFGIYFDNNPREIQDESIIEKYYEKAYSKFSRKYEDTYILKKKITEKLMRDGFSYGDISDYFLKIEF